MAYATGRQAYETSRKKVHANRDETANKIAGQIAVATSGMEMDRYAAVRQAHYAYTKSNNWKRGRVETGISATQTGIFATMSGMATAVATGAVGVGIGVGSAGVGFGTISGLFAGLWAYKAGRQTVKDGNRDLLTDFLKSSETVDKTKLARLVGLPGETDPSKLTDAAVQEVVRREPILVADALLSSLHREVPPLGGDELFDFVAKLAHIDSAKSSDTPLNDAEQAELDFLTDDVEAEIQLRLAQSPTAGYLAGMGVPIDHLLAIVDSYQTKDSDALNRQLINYALKRMY